MNELKKIWLALAAWTGLIFMIGLAVGDGMAYHSADKEIIELDIELTKLNIKKLKGECNGIN